MEIAILHQSAVHDFIDVVSVLKDIEAPSVGRGNSLLQFGPHEHEQFVVVIGLVDHPRNLFHSFHSHPVHNVVLEVALKKCLSDGVFGVQNFVMMGP